MDDKATDYLPCPFCGEEPLAHAIPAHTHVLATFMPDHPGSFVIECPACGIGLINDTQDKALAVWNRRVRLSDKEGR